jgi:hypothetical protein
MKYRKIVIGHFSTQLCKNSREPNVLQARYSDGWIDFPHGISFVFCIPVYEIARHINELMHE